MPRSRLLATLGVVVLLAAVGTASWLRRGRAQSATELLPYQARVGLLPSTEQERFAQVSAAIRQAEAGRATNKAWPSTLGVPGLTWVQRGKGLYVNYLGIPAEPEQLRWLVLLIEPEPSAIKDKAPPEDEQHHTLSDGTPIHVSVWTAANQGAVPEVVLPFPAAEDWIQRLSP